MFGEPLEINFVDELKILILRDRVCSRLGRFTLYFLLYMYPGSLQHATPF
jgi:hypothetical protein